MAFSKTLAFLALACLMVMVADAESEVRFGRQMLQRLSCFKKHGYDYFGGDFKRHDNIKSWRHCCNLCTQSHPRCKGFTWRSIEKHCWLKETLRNYQKCDTCYTSRIPARCAPTYGYDYFGGDIKRVDNVRNWQSCCSLCNENPTCIAYTYRTESKHCWLKKELGNYQKCPTCYTQQLH